MRGFSHSKITRSIVNRHCDCCRVKINKGSDYVRVKGLCEESDSFYSVAHCIDCEEITRLIHQRTDDCAGVGSGLRDQLTHLVEYYGDDEPLFVKALSELKSRGVNEAKDPAIRQNCDEVLAQRSD